MLDAAKIGLLLIAIVCFETVDAQHGRSDAAVRKKKPPSLTQTDGVHDAEANKTTPVLAWNVLKLEPLAWLIGDVPLMYERMLNPQVAFELELGPTLKPQFAWRFSDLLFDESAVEHHALTPALGLLVGLNVKYYLGVRRRAPAGFFLAAGARVKQYHAYTYGFDRSGKRQFSGNEKFMTPLQVIDFVRITVGKNTTFDKFFAGYYLGFSLRQRVRTTDAAVQDDHSGILKTVLTMKKNVLPSFMCGIRVGYLF